MMQSENAVVVGGGAFRYRVEPSWTIPADRECGEIVGVACDSRDRVFLFARGPHPVMVHDREGNQLAAWGEGLFSRPHGIFIGPGDVVYLTDDCGHKVSAFTTEGKPLFSLQAPGSPSDTGVVGMDYRTIKQAAGPFNFPTNLAIAPGGDLYVADGYGNARIHRYSADGQLRHSWGEPGSGPGQFHIPHGIAIDTAGTIYAADRENSRIQLFTPAGTFLGQWTEVVRPCQMYIDRQGWIYVVELGFRAGRWPGTGSPQPGDSGGRVSIFDRSGKLHARWGGGADPCAAGDFFAPHDIWVDSHGDIYLAEVTLSAGGRAGLVPTSCHTFQKFVHIS